MPSGCGEQNMIGYAPNVYVMQYLKRTGQLTAELETRLKTYMSSGAVNITTELDTAMHSQKAVSAYFTNQQILSFA